MVDYGSLAPEINSARLYSGPGSTSLTSAASAWNTLASELNSAALDYQNIVTQLSSEEWLGSSSAAMESAVSPYVEWMSTTASQAEEAATQASAAAAAYETALSSVTPPPVIAANRAELTQLVSTNVLGQNSAAIAANEAEYGNMWAQSASAMYSYAGQSASATKVTSFTDAPQITNSSAQATQSAAVSSATGTSAGNSQSTLSQVPSTLQSLASSGSSAASSSSTSSNSTNATSSSASSSSSSSSSSLLTEIWYLLTGQTSLPTSLGALINGYSPFAGLFYNTEGLPYFSVGMANSGVQMAKTLGLIGGAAASAAKALPGLGGLGGMLGGGAHVAASLGNATAVGPLSVPPVWAGTGASPAITHAIPVSTVSATPEANGYGNVLGGMPFAGSGADAGARGPRYGVRPTVMARPPLGG
ncbi:PPE family protein [Mycobacterium sp. M23085]|uniref:PPE family protein n=1 Tax=Mycobacterium sp. M23085 TaxID=3378087 RepID=UPI003877BCF2